ncbi:MAG: hypothetical protein ACF8PN_11745 [Phycisphaerales bacterium]
MTLLLSTTLAGCGLALTAAAEPRELAGGPSGQYVEPVAIGAIYADGTLGEAIPYVGGDNGACFRRGFDAFEAAIEFDPCFRGKGAPVDGALNGGFDPWCDVGGFGSQCVGPDWRWFFTGTYSHGGRRVSANSVVRNAVDDNICRFQMAWSNNFDPGDTDPNGNLVGDTVIAVSTYDGHFDQFCGSQEPNFLTGIWVSFGALPASPTSYYWTDIDLAGFGIPLTVPPGEFGHEIEFFYDTQLSVRSANNQTWMWAPKDIAAQGESLPIVYDDDNWDGIYDPFTECFDYTLGFCPDPVGGMVVFYIERGDDCIDVTTSAFVGGSPATFTLLGGQPNESFAISYFLSEQDANAACDCADPLTASVGNFLSCNGGTSNLVGQGRLDGAGDGSFTVGVPRAASGRTFYFVTFTPDADGTFCCVVNEVTVL